MSCRVRFFPDQPDVIATAVRLAERAYKSRRPVALRVEDEALAAAVSKALWEARPGSFLPNVRATDPLAAETPIVLLLPPELPPTPRPVWVQIARSLVEPLPACEWLFEVIGQSEAEKRPARERYRRYQQLGCLVDVAKGAS